MSQQLEKLAVLFADISGSTALYDHLGDELARRLTALCISHMCGEIEAQQGRLVKTIGDEIMCTFASAEQAFHAACAMQHAVERAEYEGDHKMHVRIGFHYGDVILEGGDVFGDTVNVAARVAAITRAGQIMTTLAVADKLPPELREKMRQLMRAEFKGKQGAFDIFLVIWELDDMLNTRIGIPAYRRTAHSNDELTLTYGNQTIRVNKDRRSAMLGRENVCDIVVPGDFASRQHVRVEYRQDKFAIVDQSTNGTYVRTREGDVYNIAREEMILHGTGSISLGQPYSTDPTDLIEFSIVTAQS